MNRSFFRNLMDKLFFYPMLRRREMVALPVTLYAKGTDEIGKVYALLHRSGSINDRTERRLAMRNKASRLIEQAAVFLSQTEPR